jgi:phthiocerol/phenolphthiocerol synthesis type-I polyketide synthase E
MSTGEPVAAPREIIDAVTRIWCRVLNRKTVPPDASFVQLGGDSLLFIAVLTEIQDQFGVYLEAADVLDDLTVVGIARVVALAQG